MSQRQRKGEAEEWPRERVGDATQQKTWPATFDSELEKDSSESWGPRWLLLWHSPRRWLLAPKNGSAHLQGRPVEIHVSGAPSFLSLVLLSRSDSSIYAIKLTEEFKSALSKVQLRSAALF